MTKRSEKATPLKKDAKKLTLGKKTLKDLGTKDAGKVRGGTAATLNTYCCTALTACPLRCAKTANTCVKACQ